MRMKRSTPQSTHDAFQEVHEETHSDADRQIVSNEQLVQQIKETADKLIRDQANGGDIKLMHLKYFFTRKLLFVKESDAIALFPGGFGTQDEGFEVLTLVQTGKSHIFPIVLVDEPGGDYWRQWHHYVENVLVARG